MFIIAIELLPINMNSEALQVVSYDYELDSLAASLESWVKFKLDFSIAPPGKL